MNSAKKPLSRMSKKKKPKAVRIATLQDLKSMTTLMELLIKVADTGNPMLTKLGLLVANEKHDIVTIWVGKGANASPYDRIVELREECDELRAQLSAAIGKP